MLFHKLFVLPYYINYLHSGHIGIVKMEFLACSFIYWIIIDNDLDNKVPNNLNASKRTFQNAHIPLGKPYKALAKKTRTLRVQLQVSSRVYLIVDALSKLVEIIPKKSTTSIWCIVNTHIICYIKIHCFLHSASHALQFRITDVRLYHQNMEISLKTLVNFIVLVLSITPHGQAD